MAFSPDSPWIAPPVVLEGTQARATMGIRAPHHGPTRASEFAAGRRCAAQALRDAGSVQVDVGVGPRRNPLWPAGFTGSITHSPAIAWAAVAPIGAFRSLGIDSEPIFDQESLREAGPLVLDDEERRSLRPGRELDDATLVYSAKESLYKCLDPCVGVALEFTDARVAWLAGEGETGTLAIRLLRDLSDDLRAGRSLRGRYATTLGHVHTAVWLPS